VGARVFFVTGKGGTGKSSVARALAREAAARGTRVLLIRMQASGDAALRERPPAGRGRVFPSPSLFRERTLDDQRDLEAFLTRVLGLGFVARRLGASRTFSAVAAAAPGLRDLVALSTIATEASRRRGLVVVDAPATGHSIPLLRASDRVLELAPIGPVAREVERARALVRDSETFTAVLVTTPEELAIAEVVELRDEVLAAGVASIRVVVNGAWPAYVLEVEGESIADSDVSADATLHWRRHLRHVALARELEERVGRCTRIGFSFDGEEPPAADMAMLLASLEAEAP
jgi:arsenite/tail-anchored protein-transporting ATPase